MSARQFTPNSSLHIRVFMVLLLLFKFKIFAQPTRDNSMGIEDAPVSWQKARAYPTKKGRRQFRRPLNAL